MAFQVSYIYDLVDKLSPQLKKIQGNLKNTATSAKNVANDINNSFNKISRSLQNVSKKINDFGSKVRGAGGNLLPFSAGITLGGVTALKSAANFETLAMKMEVLTGSAEKGKKLFDEVVKVSAQTPFELNQLADQTTKLMGYGVAAEDVVKQLLMIGDVAAISGGDLNGITTAFGQAAAAGKVMTRDLLQFVNNGVPMYKMLAKTMNVPTKSIQDLASQGRITFDVLLKSFEEATAKGGLFENGMDKLSRTLSGLYSNIKDSLNIAFGQLGSEMAKTVNLKDLMISLSESINKVAEKFNKLSPRTKKFITYAIIFSAVLAPVLITLGQVALGVGALILVFGAIASPIGLISAAIVALTATFAYFYDNIKEIYTFIKDKFLGVLNQISESLMNVKRFFGFETPKMLQNMSQDITQNVIQNVSPIPAYNPINLQSSINKRQEFSIGGRLDVNLNNMPKGSNAKYTPMRQSVLPVGVNSVYGGV